jgi:neutral ceramidase
VQASHMTRRDMFASMASLLATGVTAKSGAQQWRIGSAALDITPETSLWMAGFALRTQPARGTALPLKAKALAIQAGDGPPAVLVTADLLGVTARLTSAVAAEVRRRHGIPRSHLLFNASHTHCGPVVDEQLSVAYDLTPAQWADVRSYSTRLEKNLGTVITQALARLRPATLAFARGTVDFARNRRVQFGPDGPVDHSVPVLRVVANDGALQAIVFGYSCHNTTLQHEFVEYHGDYAGVAQAALEKRHPGAVALFVAGCGADANPHPRGTLELAQAHGVALADAVDRSLDAATPVAPPLRTAYGIVNLPFASADVRKLWRSKLKIEERYLSRYDALMRTMAAREGRLPAAQPAPVQVWRFGPALPGSSPPTDLTLIAIGGEVVVDYAIRLAGEYPTQRIWAAGYSNDVFGYLPSRRVLLEGGYEGADAMVYYGRPGPFTANVEELIIGQIRRFATSSSARESPGSR